MPHYWPCANPKLAICNFNQVLAQVLQFLKNQGELCKNIFGQTQKLQANLAVYRQFIWDVGRRNNLLTTSASVSKGCRSLKLSLLMSVITWFLQVCSQNGRNFRLNNQKHHPWFGTKLHLLKGNPCSLTLSVNSLTRAQHRVTLVVLTLKNQIHILKAHFAWLTILTPCA